MQTLAADCGISEKTIFAGYQANVRPYRDMMDVCVFPSENEPFGLAALEALSSGKPTVIFQDSGGLAEIIGGYCAEDVVPDLGQLSNRLEYYYVNRICLNGSSAEARVRHAHKFDINTTAANFFEIYKRLVGSVSSA
jgi:glycosyltransferase involved in cell wall biosynthesis